MAKLPRKTQKIFCSKPTSENQTSVFGTMKTADKQYSTDVGTLQSNAAYEQGWKSATIASYKPFMEDFNTLNYINTSQLAYLFQQGIPEWDEATAYYKNSFCSYNGDLWQSLIDDNLGNAPFEGDEWTLFSTKNKGGGLELCDIGTALYVDETKGLRRILNGGILDITFNYKAFLNRLLKIQTTNPDYFTTEENWQAEKTMNIDGCVYKFVLNYDSTGTNVISVRLPKYPDYVEINNNSINNTAPVAVYGNGRGLGLVDSVNSPTYRTLIDYSYPNNIEGLVPGNLTFDHNTVFPVGQDTSNQSGYIRNVFWGVSQNANSSGLTGTATITSNFRQTKLKLRYFIQIATGQETENNIVNEIELNNPSFFGDSKYVPTEVNNLSWLKSEGQNNPKGTYPSFYDWILENVNKGEEGFKLSTATDITDYDFVINTADETFRLPLLNGSEDLPSDRYIFNIISNSITTTNQTYTAPANGWVYIKGHQTTGGSIYAHIRTPFDVETSVSGAGAAVNSSFKRFVKRGDTLAVWSDGASFGNVVSYFQYAQGNGSLYYYVGETVQNANLIDAGRIGEILPTKTDMQQAAKASMPSDRYIDLTLGASGSTYTAPANGWVSLNCQTKISTAGTGTRFVSLYVNNKTQDNTYRDIKWFVNSSPNLEYGGILPINKFDTFRIDYPDGSTLSVGSWETGLRFYYAEGSK